MLFLLDDTVTASGRRRRILAGIVSIIIAMGVIWK